MFEHEGLLKEFEWVTKESEKKHIGDLYLKLQWKCKKLPLHLFKVTMIL